MKLKELLQDIPHSAIAPHFFDIEIEHISCDSRTTEAKSLFVAIPGTSLDGRDFVPEAIHKGAIAVAYEKDKAVTVSFKDVCPIVVEDARNFLLAVCQRFHEFPAKKINVIGITGTNGKTTTSYLLEHIFKSSGRPCGVIGTVNHRLGQQVLPSKNTTPGIVELQEYFVQMVHHQLQYCVMEVSSHALKQGRVAGVDFRTAIFTNLTQDHLDYHKDMEDYFQAKSKLFRELSPQGHAIINVDDPYGERLFGLILAKEIRYGIMKPADIHAQNIELSFSGSALTVHWPEGVVQLKTPLIGLHNIYNILAAWAAAFIENIPPEEIKRAVERFRYVPGRLEGVTCGQNFFVYVDYAHTDDALRNVLSSFRRINPTTRIILVFGCGGNRDKTKRPKMGEVASLLADFSIITSDNPRQEEPQAIIQNIVAGFKGSHYCVIPERREAIQKALSLAHKGDIVLIAGKGHEDYQIFKDKTIHFDDREVVREYLKCLV